ncbi:hypothetical protein K6V26_05520 [Parabacteroides goldsteinii]|uniref:hypothetical protein n=1 Tax=Parabacteroides goldsteinii TaxID=328812 RepID=UPI001CC9BAAE|nr:hypothetical protein [Parabacteroides goldsteinii]UBD75802.1 hypothetical protein K6V26_05520 [Parabacteroides goldsteinii]
MKKEELKPGYPPMIPVEAQIRLLHEIVFDLNLLAINLPFEIQMVSKDKGFSEEYLKDIGVI